MNNNEYIRLSLEMHLFFDRIMKEHSFFLEAAFTEKNNDFKQVARNFQNTFSDILAHVVSISNENISNAAVDSNEFVTKNTLDSEIKTSNLTGIPINSSITENELLLRGKATNQNDGLLNIVSNINKQTLPIIEDLINFKNNILNEVITCKMYTTNYPLLISHIMSEAKMYHNLLQKIENRTLPTQNELFENELFWNNIMKEHAQFIRGLLDPSEEQLILTANNYVEEYKEIINNFANNPLLLTNTSLATTLQFRDFKIAGEEGILNCKIKSIIIPLLADHVVREANHFIRILRSFNR